jgi:hypothetical protein
LAQNRSQVRPAAASPHAPVTPCVVCCWGLQPVLPQCQFDPLEATLPQPLLGSVSLHVWSCYRPLAGRCAHLPVTGGPKMWHNHMTLQARAWPSGAMSLNATGAEPTHPAVPVSAALAGGHGWWHRAGRCPCGCRHRAPAGHIHCGHRSVCYTSAPTGGP